MAKLLYPKFLTNAKQYAAAQAFWQQLWQYVLREAGKLDCWHTPWLKANYADRTSFRDGNPIHSAVNEAERLGVRIIQEQPSSQGKSELDYWVDTFGDRTASNSIRELVISTVLDEDTRQQAYDLLHDWVTRRKLKPTRKSSPARPTAKINTILDAADRRIDAGRGLGHDDFWLAVEAKNRRRHARNSKPRRAKNTT